MPEDRTANPPEGTGGDGGERPPAQNPPSGETPPAGGAPQTPATPASSSARGAASSEDDGIDLSDLPAGTPDAVREVIRRERRDRRAAELRAREAEGRLSERERAEMTELERERADRQRLEGEVQRLTEAARSRAVREAVADLAPRLGISDPKLAARLLDATGIEFTDTGEPKGKALEQKLEALKSEYPSIAARRRGSSDAGAGRGAETNEGDINARIRERIRR